MCRQVVKNIPNPPSFRKVNIGEIAHVGREVHSRSAGGDFDLSPWAMCGQGRRTDWRFVALIFVIVPLGLAWLGCNRLMGLADQLGRALIKTDNGALRHRSRVHLHACSIFAIRLWECPHLLAPRLELIFG